MVKKTINNLLAKIGYVINKRHDHLTDKNDAERLAKYVQEHDVIKLHFGCGPRVLKDWVNIDLSYAHYGPYLQYYTDKDFPVAIRGDRNDLFIVNILKDGLPLPDDSVDIIFHEDFFEHLTQKEQFIFLAETLRVMKKGAVQRINTPNLLASMRDNSSFSKGKVGVFVGEWDNWHHFNIMTPVILEEMAKITGYTEIKFNSKNQSIIVNELPLEYRPGEDRPTADGNVFADLIK